jgi:hypothetical protein
VSTNLSHYRSSADYENGLHWTGVPTPVVIGTIVAAEGKSPDVIQLGSSTALNLSDGGDAKFLEFKGDGLEGGLGRALDRKEAQMAVLGARILAPEKRQGEAAETAAIHRSGENSVLSALAGAVSKAITRALTIAAAWMGKPDLQVTFTLNTDYLPTPIDAQTLTALVAAWQSGAISLSELFEALVQGEVIRSSKTEEEHTAEIEMEAERRQAEEAAKLDRLAARMAEAKRGAEAQGPEGEGDGTKSER